MSEGVIAALITGAVSLIGIIVTVALSNRSLMDKMDKDNAIADERIRSEIAIVKNDVQQLRGEVQKHNGVIERTYKLEQESAVHTEQLKVVSHRLADIEASKAAEAR